MMLSYWQNISSDPGFQEMLGLWMMHIENKCRYAYSFFLALKNVV